MAAYRQIQCKACGSVETTEAPVGTDLVCSHCGARLVTAAGGVTIAFPTARSEFAAGSANQTVVNARKTAQTCGTVAGLIVVLSIIGCVVVFLAGADASPIAAFLDGLALLGIGLLSALFVRVLRDMLLLMIEQRTVGN